MHEKIYLQPGEYFWGSEKHQIKTLLGSCVAICVWHPVRRIGGMSHCLLPSRGLVPEAPPWPVPGGPPFRQQLDLSSFSGKYIDETFEIFFAQMSKHATNQKEYQVKIFGGGNMFELTGTSLLTVGEKNLTMLRSILNREQMQITAQHVGGKGHRNVIFELWSGDCWVRHADLNER